MPRHHPNCHLSSLSLFLSLTLTIATVSTISATSPSPSPSPSTSPSPSPSPSPSLSPGLVHLPLGNIQGSLCTNNPLVYQFLGVPVGTIPRRFAPPQPYIKPYPEPALNATTRPSACPATTPNGTAIDPDGYEEDCLTVNIWVPAEATAGSQLAVRAYIYGGAFRFGSAGDTDFNGCPNVGADGTILVDLQYRLGALGFLSHPATFAESNTTGNWGIMDQQMGLKWIQNHISAFGGDPSRVLLFGQSAGGWSVNIHVASPYSKGLFWAAVSESAPGSLLSTAEEQYKITTADFVASLGCTSENPEIEISCLREIPLEELLLAQPPAGSLNSFVYFSMPSYSQFNPVVDGNIIPMQLFDAFDTENFNNVSYMGGLNLDEGRVMFSPAMVTSASNISTFLSTVYPGADVSEILALHPAEDYESSEYPYFDQIADFFTDIFMKCPLFNTLEILNKQNVLLFSYYFLHTPSCPSNEAYIGPAHGREIKYVFNKVNLLEDCSNSTMEVETYLASSISEAWSNMAKNGFPSIPNILWTEWSLENDNVMFLNDTIVLGHPNWEKDCVVYNKYTSLLARYPG